MTDVDTLCTTSTYTVAGMTVVRKYEKQLPVPECVGEAEALMAKIVHVSFSNPPLLVI